VAFPNTGVLDSFNAGAFQNLSARAGWSGTVLAAHDWITDSTPTLANANLTPGGNMWGSQWTDAECWCTFTTLGSGVSFDICARVQAFSQFGSTYYCVRATTSTFRLVLMNGGGATTLATYGPGITGAAGDAIGVEVLGSTINGYYKPSGGSWSQLITATDSTITGLGNLALTHVSSNTVAIDEFGGGQGVAPPAAPPRQIRVVRRIGSGA